MFGIKGIKNEFNKLENIDENTFKNFGTLSDDRFF
jgi:hypothetical protein